MTTETSYFTDAFGKTRASEIDGEGNETIRDLTTDEEHALWAGERNSHDAAAQASDDNWSER